MGERERKKEEGREREGETILPFVRAVGISCLSIQLREVNDSKNQV